MPEDAILYAVYLEIRRYHKMVALKRDRMARRPRK